MAAYFLIDDMGLFSAAINGIFRTFCGTNCATGAFVRVNPIFQNQLTHFCFFAKSSSFVAICSVETFFFIVGWAWNVLLLAGGLFFL
ncbi:MAG: hypothetical protein RBR87_00470 [Bacteroidales bacterium]|jgi:hypothetical protein|nr:hypothetical protein [Bacteroidales bacterium]